LDERLRKPKAHEMGMQIPCGIYPEVPKADDIWADTERTWGSVSRSGRSAGVPNRGRAPAHRPCAHVDKYSAQGGGIAGDRVHQGKKCNIHSPNVSREDAKFHR